MDRAEHASDSPSLIDFSAAFRAELAQKAEFSYTALADWLGVMVVGLEGPFTDRALSFLTAHDAWRNAADILRVTLLPSIVGYRADWRGQRLVQDTVYLRPARAMPWIRAQDAVEAALARAWTGPNLGLVSTALDLPGPSIIGLRRAGHEEPRASAYFPLADGRVAAVTRLAGALEIPPSALTELRAVLASIRREPSIVGIDSSPDARQVLKIDVPDVPVTDAARFLGSAGYSGDARRIVNAARSLRRTTATYVGIKLEPRGIGGWKIYMQAWPATALEHNPHVRVLVQDHPAHASLAR